MNTNNEDNQRVGPSQLQPNPAPMGRGGILVDSVSKRFRKAPSRKHGYTTIKSSLLSRILGIGRKERRVFTALDRLSLTIPPGSSLGIVGKNGSGKSTLLKLIAGIYRADTGSVKVNGRISALIELGAGFHPEFTGRENIYLGGVMYGLTRKEIDARFDAIVSYAELEEFIDEPVRTYSSGMYMRLGFSVAVHSDPDILLIDEVLAVGDAAFIHRCHETISEFKRRGKTMILVSHDLSAVERWCDEAIWLEHGKVKKRGEPRWVIDSYIQEIREEEETELGKENERVELLDTFLHDGVDGAEEQPVVEPLIEDVTRWGSKQVELTSVKMLGSDGAAKWIFDSEESVTVEVQYQITAPVEDLVFGIGILRADGITVHGTNTDLEGVSVPIPRWAPIDLDESGKFKSPFQGMYRYQINRLGLLDDSYFVDVAAHKLDGYPFDYHHRLHRFSVRDSLPLVGVYVPEHQWKIEPAYNVVEPTSEVLQNKTKAVGE